MNSRRAPWLLLCVMFAFAPSSNAQVAPADREAAGLAAEQAGQLREAFDDYVAALQALPESPPADADRRLRERIIKLALRLDPPPRSGAIQISSETGRCSGRHFRVPTRASPGALVGSRIFQSGRVAG